jgi:hypothetical protein
MIYYDVTINMLGVAVGKRIHDSDTLHPEGVRFFVDMLAAQGDDFHLPLPLDAVRHIQLSWSSPENGVALASYYHQCQLATTSVLLAGTNPEAEQRVLNRVQRMLTAVIGAGPLEPGCDLLNVPMRPVILTIPWADPAIAVEDLYLIADMENCLAAAFFVGVAP